MKTPLIALLALVATSSLATGAAAHVVAAPDAAKAGSYAAIAFRVGHACAAGDTTLKVRIEIPDGVASARPQVKPGWTYTLERGPDPKAAPTAITFEGRLPNEAFDDFAVLMKLPVSGDRLVFPVIQTCEKGESQWTEVADPARPDEKLSRPAPVVTLIPAPNPTGAAPAAHQH
ncbi:YcnI family protein [Caulobacter sp. FWC2]|uniref:YcnI family copper-binding membrane protein n=1 Tax=Caulobacter sp. FWC2 TaxID=69664 RepID=UPI000C15EC04|nr:YcnI family protein [Caulobacter sp. FWC2]PIB94184.1 nuclear export factor GLE1 [Caulobacter sp. FWC2]